jgi:hypothetical protein
MDRDALRSRKVSPATSQLLPAGLISFVISRVAGDPAGGGVRIAPVSAQLPANSEFLAFFDVREAVLTMKAPAPQRFSTWSCASRLPPIETARARQ